MLGMLPPHARKYRSRMSLVHSQNPYVFKSYKRKVFSTKLRLSHIDKVGEIISFIEQK